MPSLLPFLALIILSTDVAAGSARFDCTVTSVHAISEQGEVVTDTDHLKKQVGSKFSVDRRTGAIRGGYFINNEYSKETNVINDPADNSYYAVTTSHGPSSWLATSTSVIIARAPGSRSLIRQAVHTFTMGTASNVA